MTETLIERIQRHEGFCELPKIDIAPMYVIGFGHDITQSQASTTYAAGIDYADALNLLEADIARCTDQADTQISCFESLSAIRQDVIIEMVYQLGMAGTLEFKSMISALEQNDFAKAAYEMTNSDWHKQTPSRCEELAGVMLKGVI